MHVEEILLKMEKKVGTLKIEYPEIPFSLIGINTPLSDFQLAYRIQKIAGFDFEKTNNFSVYKEKQKKEFAFDCLLYADSCNSLAYLLMPSNSFEDDSVVFLSGLQKIDYVLLVLGRDYKEATASILKAVKMVKNVVYANIFYQFNFSKIKGQKQNEIHSLSEDIESFKDSNPLLENIYI